MEVILSMLFIGIVIWYVNMRLRETNIDRSEIDKAEKVAKNFEDSNDFRKM